VRRGLWESATQISRSWKRFRRRTYWINWLWPLWRPAFDQAVSGETLLALKGPPRYPAFYSNRYPPKPFPATLCPPRADTHRARLPGAGPPPVDDEMFCGSRSWASQENEYIREDSGSVSTVPPNLQRGWSIAEKLCEAHALNDIRPIFPGFSSIPPSRLTSGHRWHHRGGIVYVALTLTFRTTQYGRNLSPGKVTDHNFERPPRSAITIPAGKLHGVRCRARINTSLEMGPWLRIGLCSLQGILVAGVNITPSSA